MGHSNLHSVTHLHRAIRKPSPCQKKKNRDLEDVGEHGSQYLQCIPDIGGDRCKGHEWKDAWGFSGPATERKWSEWRSRSWDQSDKGRGGRTL